MTSKTKILIATAVLLTVGLVCDPVFARMQQPTGPLTYPEIVTALQTKLPNAQLPFRNKTELIVWISAQIKRRKVDKPLTKDREDDLRQAGATDALLQVIRTNSPAVKVEPVGPVDLGELKSRAVDLVKPEYTQEAIKAKTTGEVKLALELDEAGRVTAVTRLTVLPNGLTEKAIDAARRTTFRPAVRDGKPARGTGTITYNFKLNQLDVAATLAAANSLREQRQCERANAEFARVLEIEPGNAGALFGRGTCHLMMKNYSAAITDLSSSAAVEPQNSDVLFFLALSFDFLGEPGKAAENYGKAIRIRPELDTQPTFQCLYIDRGRMTAEQAKAAANGIIEACNKAYRGAAADVLPMLYLKRSVAYRLKGDFDKAISELESLRRSNPSLPALNKQLQIAYNGRGNEAFYKKNYREAFDDISLAIHADPQAPIPYVNRCVIYLYTRKQYREALEDCTSAIRLGANSSTVYSHRGFAYEMVNSRNEAISDYKKALEIDPRNETARSNLTRLESSRPSMRY